MRLNFCRFVPRISKTDVPNAPEPNHAVAANHKKKSFRYYLFEKNVRNKVIIEMLFLDGVDIFM